MDDQNITIEEQLKRFDNAGFDNSQMYEIREGFEHGLNIDQVRRYAKSDFDNDQMFEIRKGIENGLTAEQIDAYADSKLNSSQMHEIRHSFESVAEVEKAGAYAKPKSANISDEHRQIIDQYLNTHTDVRKFELFVGPTNSGKTHNALDVLADAESGVYLGPLRLLATEVFTELNNDRNVPCSLLTGEEHRDTDGASHVASTVEMLNTNCHYDVAVIDEAQMLGDDRRGGSWTRAILGVNADKVCVCCAPEAEDLIKDLINIAGDELVETHYTKRLTDMEFDGEIEISDIKPHDAIVVFSVRGVEETAGFLEMNGWKCSRIYGAMPPEMRIKEEERFSSGKTDIVVSTDAIGMGLNLPIERMVFSETAKFDGKEIRDLLPSEIKQIAGRAGRYGIYNTGHYATFEYPEFVRAEYESDPDMLSRAYLDIPRSMFNTGEYVSEIYDRFADTEDDENSIFINEDVTEKAGLAAILEYDLWKDANTEEVRRKFFDKAEREGYCDDYSYRTEWLEARDKVTVEGLVNTKGMQSDIIRKFAEFPISTKYPAVIEKWETLFRHEVSGEPLKMNIQKFCQTYDGYNDADLVYMDKGELEEKVKICDMVSYYERHFGTEKDYQTVRKCRNEYIKELGGRLDAEDEINDQPSEQNTNDMKETKQSDKSRGDMAEEILFITEDNTEIKKEKSPTD